METIGTDVGDVVAIPKSLGQDISRGVHLRKIGPVEDNAINRLQMNLRQQLIQLLRLNETLSPADFANRKMEVLAMVPPDLCEIPSIQKILNEVRGINSVNIVPKTGLQKIGDFFRKYL